MEIKFYRLGQIDRNSFKYAVIGALFEGKWIFVRNRHGETWEMPGGHREKDEDIDTAAARELYEESGAIEYELEGVCDYSVTEAGVTSYGRLFYSRVTKLGPLPESEIGEISMHKKMPENLTYPLIQPHLFNRILEHLKNILLHQLERDGVRNVNMINFIKNYGLYSMHTAGESALVRGRSDEDWVYISSESRKEFDRLMGALDSDDKCFAILEDWMLPLIAGKKAIRSSLTSMRLVYDPGSPLPQIRSEVVPLAENEASFIYENSKYREYLSIEYIKDRIANGTSLGIYEDGKLAAWAITHDDGAIGFLNVMEPYRRKGYGLDVTAAMIKRLQEIGEIPFVHIEENNTASTNLALKAGFRRDRRVHWIKLY